MVGSKYLLCGDFHHRKKHFGVAEAKSHMCAITLSCPTKFWYIGCRITPKLLTVATSITHANFCIVAQLDCITFPLHCVPAVLFGHALYLLHLSLFLTTRLCHAPLATEVTDGSNRPNVNVNLLPSPVPLRREMWLSSQKQSFQHGSESQTARVVLTSEEPQMTFLTEGRTKLALCIGSGRPLRSCHVHVKLIRRKY